MTEQKQSDKFKDAARDLDCDESEQRFKERLSKIAEVRPVTPKSESSD